MNRQLVDQSLVRQCILGVEISCINMRMAIEQFDKWLVERSIHYVCVTPAHSIMDSYTDPKLRPIFNASGMTTPDGMAVVWILHLKGHREVKRVYGPDLLLAICMHGLEKNYRHFFFGGAPAVAEKLAEKLSRRVRGLKVAGTLTPPFHDLSAEEDETITDQINAARADIVWVGLSSPKQEIWMHAHLGKLNAPVMVGVGAAFDFIAGNKPQAPIWMQHSGLEWLFRFANEPKRLWPRYRQYPRFVLLVIAEWLSEIKIRPKIERLTK